MPGAALAVHHAERQLLDGLARVARGPAGRPDCVLLVLHLSRVPAPGPRPHHRRIAASVLDDAAGRSGGQLFGLATGDMALLFRPGDGGAAVAAQLCKLFQSDLGDPAALLSQWPLPGGMAEAAAFVRAGLLGGKAAAPAEERGSAGVIASMDQLVQTAPAAELMHRQTAVVLRPGQAVPIAPLFREVAISTSVLEAKAAAAGQGQADPFLFSHLSVRLDRRMLAALRADVPAGGPLSGGLGDAALHVNLTLAGILSEAFSAFAEVARGRMGAGLRIAVELPFVEVFEDPKAFVLARERLRLAGMGLVLDGVTRHALVASAPAVLGPQLVKLSWSPGLGEDGAAVRAAIGALGRERVVLHRVESEAALAWGMSQGVLRFQGRYVDQMLAAGRLRNCRGAADCTVRQCTERAAASGAPRRGGCANLPLLDAGVPRGRAAVPGPAG